MTTSADQGKVPSFIYGTAWKQEDTSRLTRMALDAGFRGIDTANQRRHYLEAGVGEAISRAFDEGIVRRDDLFLQTKFTYVAGQDHRLPYDPGAPVAKQVEQSFASSLEHLGIESLDSFVLHGPSTRHGLTDTDWSTWGAMEALQRAGKTRWLAVSNVAFDQLEELYEGALVKPAFVQNRCFASMGWDLEVRRFCRERGLRYQGFSLLTANPEVFRQPRLHEIARRLGADLAQVVFAFARQVGMIALTGTTSAEHMTTDLAAQNLKLEAAEIADIERLVA
jgi:diketogulonate reductase-like aldo/keto reductase